MTPDEIRKDGERTKRFVVGFAWVSIAAIIALYFAVSRHLTWEDLVNYGIVVPLAVLWQVVHSPIFWIVVGQILVLAVFGSIGRAWQTHRDQQRRIIQLLEDIDRNERARYIALAEKVEHCARTLAQEYREHQYE